MLVHFLLVFFKGGSFLPFRVFPRITLKLLGDDGKDGLLPLAFAEDYDEDSGREDDDGNWSSC